MNFVAPADDAIPEFLDRRPFIGTFSNLDMFRSKCEYRFYRTYIKRDQQYVESPEMKWGNTVHDAFAERLAPPKLPLPDDMRQWETFAEPFDKYKVLCEQKLAMTDRAALADYWKAPWFRGKADAVVLHPEKQMAFIADWKTGNSKYEDPFELATNALLVKIKYPEIKKVVGSYIWLKENRVGQQYDLSDFKGTFLEIKRLMDLVLEKRASGEWLKQRSGLCGYCSVSDCEHWYEARK
jgi:PD-(D/E)XK nuclease superfamily